MQNIDPPGPGMDTPFPIRSATEVPKQRDGTQWNGTDCKYP